MVCRGSKQWTEIINDDIVMTVYWSTLILLLHSQDDFNLEICVGVFDLSVLLLEGLGDERLERDIEG